MACQRMEDSTNEIWKFAYIEYIAKRRSLRLKASKPLIFWPSVLLVVYICGADVCGVAFEGY